MNADCNVKFRIMKDGNNLDMKNRAAMIIEKEKVLYNE